MPEPNRTEKDNGLGRHSKTLALWVLIVLMSVLAVQFMRGQDQPAVELAYSEFTGEVERENVHEVTVVGGTTIRGEFRTPLSRQDRSFMQFVVTAPGEVSEGLVQELLDQGVVVWSEVDSKAIVEFGRSVDRQSGRGPSLRHR